MTEIAQEFLEGIKLGDHVRVCYGTSSDQNSVVGIVSRWTDNLLFLQKEDGKLTKIRLDDLRSLDEVGQKPTHAGEDSDPKAYSDAILQRESRTQLELPTLPPEKPFLFSLGNWVAQLRKKIKEIDNREFKNSVNGILDSMNDAIKGNSLPYKYHNLRTRLRNLWEICDSEVACVSLYLVLGLLAIAAEEYLHALEPLVRARQYTLAGYAASKAKLVEQTEVFQFCALLAQEDSAQICESTSRICIRRKDANVLLQLLEIYPDGGNDGGRLLSCLYSLYVASGSTIPVNFNPSESTKQKGHTIFVAIPQEWKQQSTILKCWQEYSGYSYPVKTQPEGRLTGRIKHFDIEKKYGFITAGTKDYYFRVAQVYDDVKEGILLRKVFALGLSKNLEVFFQIGKNYKNGRLAATDISLTEKGREASLALLSDGKPVNGEIEYYSSSRNNGHGYGRIRSKKKIYSFKQKDIRDPYLEAYFEHGYATNDQKVTFQIDIRQKAYNICWDTPSEEDHTMWADQVTEQEKISWDQFRQAYKKEIKILSDVDFDPYGDFPFEPLPEAIEPIRADLMAPLTWEQSAARIPTLSTDTSDTADSVSSLPKVSLPPVYVRKPSKPAPIPTQYPKESNPSNYSINNVNSVISSYLQQDRTEDAVHLLESYRGKLSDDKMVRLEIRVYEKKRDYDKLVQLYEEFLQLPSTAVSSKSHTLVQLIAVLVNRHRYSQALDACKRWETLYQQNRFGADATKLKNMFPTVERQKAICLYHSGDVAEARQIATNMLRANPSDVLANNILSGTLHADTVLEVLPGDLFADDDIESGDSQISRFVSHMIESVDIVAYLKSSNLTDGKFTGSIEEAYENVDRLINKATSVSSYTRSEYLFSACKLLDQIEQRPEDGGRQRRRKWSKLRLAGRATAAWGDYMVSQVKQVTQLDTSRMAYLFAMRALTPQKRAEQDWVNSYNRYIKSFFLSRDVGGNSLNAYINQQTNTGEKDPANTDIFEERAIPDVLIAEFLVGMLHLLDALGTKTDRARTLLQELYTRNMNLRQSLCRQLLCLENVTLPDAATQSQFSEAMKKAYESMHERMQILSEQLSEIADRLVSKALSEDLIASLEVSDSTGWKNYLTATDADRLSKIYHTVKRFQDYFSSIDFENRAECLRAVILEVNSFRETIEREPTDVSYDTFLPCLVDIGNKLSSKQDNLYQEFQPKLTWKESLQPFRTPEGQIHIQLTVENELNYQSADQLKIISVNGSEIVRSYEEKSPVIPSLRGGGQADITLEVAINDSANQSGSFDMMISYTYKCNDSPHTPITKSDTYSGTYVIRKDDFVPLKNPFRGHEGKAMEDESMFFGRDRQIEQIVEMICLNGSDQMNYGRAIAMYGQTRTGKTSLLYHLKQRLLNKYGDRVIVWDIKNIGELENLGNTEQYLAAFLYNILETGRDALEDSDIYDTVQDAHLEPPLDEILDQPAYATVRFNSYMKTLNRILMQKGRIIVFLADEFTYLHSAIREEKLSAGFMRFWKAFLQDYCVFAIVAGQDDMPEFIDEYKNEFACMELMKLTYLDEQDAKKLIRKPLGDNLFREDGAVDELYELTAGSAYLTIILCSHLVDYLNEKGAYLITKAIVDDFLRIKAFGPNSFLTNAHFEAQMQERGHPENNEANKKILLSVARGSQTADGADIDNIICDGLDQDTVQRLVDRLVDRNVLVKESTGKYRIQVKLLERWLIATMGG